MNKTTTNAGSDRGSGIKTEARQDGGPTGSTSPSSSPTPMWAVNTFSFMNSFGTGVVTNGIYFITKSYYDFSDTMNYLLGVATGVTYIAAAIGTGPALDAIRRSGVNLTGRRTLVVVMTLLALACCLPFVGSRLDAASAEPSPWPIWAMVFAYIPLTGILWPIVQSHVSGGRRGDELRSAMGGWNFVWSAATFVSLWASAPLIERNAPLMVLLLGLIHLGAAVLLRWFRSDAAASTESGDHEPHPPIYAKLLVTFRMLLPTSYVLMTALTPFMPSSMTALGVAVVWQPVVMTVFHVARSAAFMAFGRWHGWHGRWTTAIVGGTLLFAGFAASLLASAIGERTTPAIGLSVLVLGLTVFALAMALNYTAAIYYAMAVGNAEVGAGGKHEALIGLGYTVGPMCGLVPAWLVEAGRLQESSFEPVVLSAVGAIGILTAIMVLVRVAKHSRPKSN